MSQPNSPSTINRPLPELKPSAATPGNALLPGIYQIVNNVEPNQAIDLSGYDLKGVLAYPRHGGKNQQWHFERLGPGYTIRSVHNGAYITLDSAISSGATLIATPYPVSWAVDPDDWEAGIYRIRWPMSPYIVDMPPIGTHGVQLNNRYPFKNRALWKLVRVDDPSVPTQPEGNNPTDTHSVDEFEVVTHAPRTTPATQPKLDTQSETVIDVEGLKLGGNGEMSITTTTTTVTTSVTVVKRLGVVG